MNQPGVCYVADANFLLPALLSTTSLRRHHPVGTLRVFVVVFLEAGIDLRTLEEGTRHLGIEFIGVTADSLPGLSGFDWSATHVTPAAVGRFLLAGLLPPEIDRILYLDGDTMVVGSLAPLLDCAMPEGSLAAADDAVMLYRRDRSRNGRVTRSYFAGIGLPDDRTYFNSGVLLVGRRAWGGIAARALDYLTAHPDRCIFHDQSALNATVGSDRVRLSPIWNFQSRFRSWAPSFAFEPRILHFTGAAKPWSGSLAPWHDVATSLAADVAALQALCLPFRRWSAEEVEAHNAQFTSLKERLRVVIDIRRRFRGLAVARLHRQSLV